jgi:hypothetical protein
MDISSFINEVEKWTREQDTIHALILVDSHANGGNKADSHIDLQLITTTPKLYIDNPSFVNNFGVVVQSKIEKHGIVNSIRIWYSNGLEVEFRITTPIWISTPLEDDTRKVLSNGYKVIIDNKNYFKKIGIYTCERN